jgi:hypothetical protein
LTWSITAAPWFFQTCEVTCSERSTWRQSNADCRTPTSRRAACGVSCCLKVVVDGLSNWIVCHTPLDSYTHTHKKKKKATYFWKWCRQCAEASPSVGFTHSRGQLRSKVRVFFLQCKTTSLIISRRSQCSLIRE